MPEDQTANQESVQNKIVLSPQPPDDKITKWSKVISTLGFPIVVAGVLLYSQLTVGSNSIELLRSIDSKLSSIDQKITILLTARPATK